MISFHWWEWGWRYRWDIRRREWNTFRRRLFFFARKTDSVSRDTVRGPSPSTATPAAGSAPSPGEFLAMILSRLAVALGFADFFFKLKILVKTSLITLPRVCIKINNMEIITPIRSKIWQGLIMLLSKFNMNNKNSSTWKTELRCFKLQLNFSDYMGKFNGMRAINYENNFKK